MKLKKCTILWTTYLDSRLTRGEGRRLAKKFCVPSPTLRDLERACRELGLSIVKTAEARYPRSWWVKGGYVAVEKVDKGEVLLKVSKKLRAYRSSKKSATHV